MLTYLGETHYVSARAGPSLGLVVKYLHGNAIKTEGYGFLIGQDRVTRYVVCRDQIQRKKNFD